MSCKGVFKKPNFPGANYLRCTYCHSVIADDDTPPEKHPEVYFTMPTATLDERIAHTKAAWDREAQRLIPQK